MQPIDTLLSVKLIGTISGESLRIPRTRTFAGFSPSDRSLSALSAASEVAPERRGSDRPTSRAAARSPRSRPQNGVARGMTACAVPGVELLQLRPTATRADPGERVTYHFRDGSAQESRCPNRNVEDGHRLTRCTLSSSSSARVDTIHAAHTSSPQAALIFAVPIICSGE